MIRELLVAALLVPELASAQPCAFPSFALPVDLGLPIEEGLSRLRSAEVDGDGRVDLLAFLWSGQVVVFWNRAGGLERGPSTVRPAFSNSLSFLDPVDLNGDGRVDLTVISNPDGGASRRLESWLGDGAGGFSMAASIPLEVGVSSRLALVRFDGGAVPDALSAILSPSDASKLQVLRWRGRGDGTFEPPSTILTLDNPVPGAGAGVVAGDVDGDGRTDLVVSSAGNSPSHPEVHPSYFYVSSLWFGDGAGGFQQSGGSIGVWATRLADVDADGRDEILHYDAQRVFSTVGILRRASDGKTWQSYASWSTTGPGDLLPGELDRDPARMEVLFQGGGVLRAYRLGETGTEAVEFATIPAWSPATLMDLDGDGHLDVLAYARDQVGVSSRLVLARNVCGPDPGTTTQFLPALLSLTGAESTRFETEVAVTNVGVFAVSAVLRLHPPDGAPAVDLASFTLEPGRVRLLSTTEDSVAERIVLPEGVDRGTATLEASTRDGSTPNVVVDVRILSERPGSGRGGVGFRARPAEGQQLGSVSELVWLKEDVEDRTNLAVASAGPDPVTLRVTVFSADSERPGRTALPDVTLAPYGSHQWNRVLTASGLGARSGWARVERLAGGPWTAWATVNSNGTGDGSVVEAATKEWGTLLPAIVGTDRYRTDVVLTNTAATSRTATLLLPPVSGDLRLALDVEVGAESSRLVDPVSALREALALPPGSYAGHATIQTSFLAGARVTTVPSRASGSFGVYTPVAHFYSGVALLVSGLRQDGRNRSNLAIVTLFPGAAVFRVELFDGRTGTLARTIEGVTTASTPGAPSRIQLDSVLQGTGIPFGWARVVCASSWTSFFAYAVVNDGEAPGLGSGDGTYLPGMPK